MGPTRYPPAERIAAFDNGETLWLEQSVPAQLGLFQGKLVEQVKGAPSLDTEDPYKSEGITGKAIKLLVNC